MGIYVCKCGRQVNKSTNADNTGNRDTDGCTGCPYLLPWGPDKYIEGQGFTKDVQGYECRMSPTISYTTTYRGQASDKCTLHILSLDLDFLDTVQAWIDDHAADTLSAGFSRGSMRGTDFSDKGRYSLSISCAQNKKGMAAKAALIEQFFTGGRVRKDMTLTQEKAHILAAIKRGKENASKMNYIISQHDNGLLYAYHLGTFWFWLADKRWVPSDFAKQEYEKAQKKNPRITPEEFMDSDDFIQMDDYEIPSQKLLALEALTPEDSRRHAPDAEDATDASTVSAEPSESVDEFSDLDRPCPGDVYRSAKGGQLYKIGELTNGKKTCYLTMRCNVQDGTWAPANSSVYPNLSDAQGEFEAWIRREQLEPVAQTMDAAVITDERAAKELSKAEETSTTSAIGADAGTSLPGSSCKGAPNSSPAPAYPADAGAAAQSLCAAEPASLEAKDMNVPAFDYSGLDGVTVDTLHLAENIIRSARQKYIIDLAGAVDMAHEELVRNSDGHNQHTEETFVAWCRSVGISKTTAYQLLQVQALLSGSTPEEQATLEAASPSLLYAAAKPSAPAELVQAVKDGDITSHKQYQEALAEIRARDAKIKDLLEMSEASDRRADEEERKCKEANEARVAAENKVQQYREIKDAALETAKQQREKTAAAESRARAAENRAAGAQKLAEQRGTENTELKAKIRELENQPRDVAVVQPGEEQIEAWRREGADRMAATMQETVRRANQEKLNAQSQVADLQQQLATARPDADACQRTADILYETAENLRILLRTQLKQAQLSPTAYGKVVAHVLQVARTLLDTVRVCSPDGYDMDSEEDDDFE